MFDEHALYFTSVRTDRVAIKRLDLDDGSTLPYDYLAICVGGRLEPALLGDLLVRMRIDPARLVEIKALAAQERWPRCLARRRQS